MRKPHSHVSTYKHFKQEHLSMGLMGSMEPTNFRKCVLKHINFFAYGIGFQYFGSKLISNDIMFPFLGGFEPIKGKS